jgi:DNA invertase Pin-like site-specific DNA recombinase
MQHKAAQGEYTGGPPPYGRRVGADGERLERAPDEEAARAVARQLRARPRALAAAGGGGTRAARRAERDGRKGAPVQVKRMVG